MNVDLLAIQVLGWAFVVVGSALITVLVWAALGVFSRLEKIETLMQHETRAQTVFNHQIDKRMSLVELRTGLHSDVII